jgi:hypothetical protein
MKKVLCGLVIALMMTGSGYANDNEELPDRYCDFLKDKAFSYIDFAWMKQQNMMKDYSPDRDLIKFNKDVMKNIKDAHYPAVIYQTFCKD